MTLSKDAEIVLAAMSGMPDTVKGSFKRWLAEQSTEIERLREQVGNLALEKGYALASLESERAARAHLADVLRKFQWAAAPERHGGTSAYPYEEICEVLAESGSSETWLAAKLEQAREEGRREIAAAGVHAPVIGDMSPRSEGGQSGQRDGLLVAAVTDAARVAHLEEVLRTASGTIKILDRHQPHDAVDDVLADIRRALESSSTAEWLREHNEKVRSAVLNDSRGLPLLRAALGNVGAMVDPETGGLPDALHNAAKELSIAINWFRGSLGATTTPVPPPDTTKTATQHESYDLTGDIVFEPRSIETMAAQHRAIQCIWDEEYEQAIVLLTELMAGPPAPPKETPNAE